jgi:hypothetical protein
MRRKLVEAMAAIDVNGIWCIQWKLLVRVD